MGHSKVCLAWHPALNSGCEWLVKEELQQGKQREDFPKDICQLLATVSLGQFLSHMVPSLSSKTLVQPPFEMVWKHSLLPWTCWWKWGACCSQGVLTKLHGTIFGVDSLTSMNSTRDGVPASVQTSSQPPSPSGNCVEDQKLPSQGLGDLIRRWKCQGSRGLRYNMLQSPWCVMFFFSPVFPHPTGLSAYAQGQLWYCTVQVWAESNTWKTWYRTMDYTS